MKFFAMLIVFEERKLLEADPLPAALVGDLLDKAEARRFIILPFVLAAILFSFDLLELKSGAGTGAGVG